MPIPRRVARWNKVGLNRVVRHVARWAPGLGFVVHRGGCGLRTGGRVLHVNSPRAHHDEGRRGIRPLERQMLWLIGVADFLSVTIVD